MGGQPVVAGGDPAEVLQATDHALNRVASTLEHGREARLPASVHFGRNVGRGPTRLDLPAKGIAVVTFVGVQRTAGGQARQQQRPGCAIRNLSARDQEGDRSTEPVGERVDLGGAPAPRAPDRLGPLPPGPPDAQRCAFTAEESISTWAEGPPA